MFDRMIARHCLQIIMAKVFTYCQSLIFKQNKGREAKLLTPLPLFSFYTSIIYISNSIPSSFYAKNVIFSIYPQKYAIIFVYQHLLY